MFRAVARYENPEIVLGEDNMPPPPFTKGLDRAVARSENPERHIVLGGDKMPPAPPLATGLDVSSCELGT